MTNGTGGRGGRVRRGWSAALVALAMAVGSAPQVAAVDAPAAVSQAEVASAWQALDRPATGAAAEGNGGYDPGMPTDQHVLRGWLDELRAAGVPPHRYSTLLAQYWLAVSVDAAGLDLDHWDPSLGLAANVGNMEKTFAYYCRLGLETPEFVWAGQGGLAGPSFAAGIMDLDLSRVVLDVREARAAVAGSLGTLDLVTRPATAGMPPDVQALLDVGDDITTADVDAFQRGVIAMSKHIFIDLVPQHHAYLAGGLPALEEYRAAGVIDDATLDAWRLVAAGVADGDRQKIVDGNLRLLHREQYDVIGDQWDRVSGYRYPVGRALTYLSTIAADPAIPGLQPPREYAPTTLEIAPGRWVRTPLPSFNWADRDARWAYITERMAPAYAHVRYEDEPTWRSVMSRPVQQRIADQRAIARLPRMLASMAAVTGSA